MTSADRYTFDRVSAPLEWHEAVAVVQEVATRAIAGETTIARRASDLAIDADGRIVLPDGGRAVPVFGALKAARAAQDLADLRALLRDLLPETTIPPALAALADAENANGNITSIADFSKALSFFERPNRARDLKVVAARLAGANEQVTLQERLAALTRKARSDEGRETSQLQPAPVVQRPSEPTVVSPAETPASSTPSPAGELEPGWDFLSESELAKAAPTPAAAKRSAPIDFKQWLPNAKTAALVAMVCSFLMMLAIGGYALRAWTSPSTEQADAGSTAAEGAQPIAGLAVEKTTGRAPRSAARAAGSQTTPAQAPQSRKSGNGGPARPERATPAAASTINGAPAVSDPGVPTPLAPVVNIPPVFSDPTRATRIGGQPLFLASGLLNASVTTWDSVFDSRDDQVQPARLLRPQLPEIPPGTVLESLGMFEFVVSMRGSVERIRLVRSPADRQYRDIMLMPAAKAWIFQPASRDGRPVRYRLQILIPQ